LLEEGTNIAGVDVNKTNLKNEVAAVTKDLDFAKKKYQVTFETTAGDINLELYPEVAPGHCANIVALTKLGFYNDLNFHRVIKGFVIQGGCPVGNGTGGPGYHVNAEFNDRPHEAGVLSMARAQDPNSAGSQFFLCLERVPYLDNQYTVFGKTADAESLAVVKKIGDMETDHNDRPKEDVRIKSAHVTESAL
jgi:peptidyl-prolyl cis-trans isomerase B (cyclophilin B)